MKIEKWYEKAISAFEKEVEDGVIAANLNNGCVYANSSGTYAFYIPGYSVLSAVWEKDKLARKSNTLRLLYKQAESNPSASLVTSEKTGRFPDRKNKVRQLSDGERNVYVYEKLLRLFPKNALFYISSATSPVFVGIWENDRLYPVGLVMPMYSAESFIPEK
jgi:hypothetical protein